ncbi:MAG: class I SAM-dependent methyltransferase [Chitinivibrionales bacterium]|nr:class I SAM-dependent methyltransferase [Chitinivibrionales bacterium]
MQCDDEKQFLDQAYSTYEFKTSSQSRVIRELAIRTITPYIDSRKSEVGLQLGCADGYETELLAKLLRQLDVLEGSIKFIDDVRKKSISRVNLIYSLFEQFKTPKRKKYDVVFATFVLEHILDPALLLKKIGKALHENGLLYVVVPNARALSRQLALHMGVLKNLYALTPNDVKHGHRRVFDRNSLNKLLESCGFQSVAQGGIMLKILADFQMDQLIDSGMLKAEHITGLYSLGLEYPDLSGAIYTICKKRT